MDACQAHLARLMEPKYLEARSSSERFTYRRRYGECLLRLERYDEAKALFEEGEKVQPDGRYRQECRHWVGRVLQAEKRYEEALKEYERVFLDYPDRIDHWYSTQSSIAYAQREQDRPEDAIRAGRICLDAVTSQSYVASWTRFIADCLKNLDDNLVRANQMINYQRFGPAGEDRKSGTDDDLKNPLDAFGYPTYPERERALASVREAAGDTAQAARLRAFTYLYTGHPKLALRHFLDAFSRTTSSSDLKRYGSDLLLIGVRAAQGHGVGFEKFVAFVNFGPAGRDGKQGTADDLDDPFARLMK